MSFRLKEFELDFGTTEIENLFINEFMPQANGTYIKVYLYGLYLANRSTDITNNDSLAKHLGLSLEDVVQAWRYWESKGLVTIESAPPSEGQHNFTVLFSSVRQIYISSNFQPIKVESKPISVGTSGDRVISAMSNPIVKGMFANIQYMVRRPLTPQEHIRVLNWITDYKMDPDMIERAFQITYEERKINDFQFNYVEAIILKWYDKRILSLAQLDEYASQIDNRHTLYKQIYQAIGIYNRQISAGDKELIDQWCDDYQLGPDLILHILKEATKRTTNPNLNYISKVIQNIRDAGEPSIESANVYFNTPVVKSSVNVATTLEPKSPKRTIQNFKQNTIASMSEEEMREVLQRKADRKRTTKGDLKT